MEPAKMEPAKMEPAKETKDDEVVVVVAVPHQQNDSADGLANLYRDLNMPALRLKSAALSLLFISLLMCGSLEGLFGIMAAAGVLCCAAPGSLGTAYAARFTRTCAMICAVCALAQLLVLCTLSFVAPYVPNAVLDICQNTHEATQAVEEPAEEPPALTVSAKAIVSFAAGGMRRLQDAGVPTPSDEQCEQAALLVSRHLSSVVLFAALMEFTLFMAAMITAKRALHLILLARRSGANAL